LKTGKKKPDRHWGRTIRLEIPSVHWGDTEGSGNRVTRLNLNPFNTRLERVRDNASFQGNFFVTEAHLLSFLGLVTAKSSSLPESWR